MADSELKSQIQVTEAMIEAFTTRLMRIFSESIDDVVAQAFRGDAQEAAAALGKFTAVLQANGLDRVLKELRAVYARQLSYINAELKKTTGKALSSVDRASVEVLIKTDLSNVGSTLLSNAQDIKSEVMRSVLLGQTIDTSNWRNDKYPRLFNQLKTELNTGMQAFNRAVIATKAKDAGVENFIYIGPDDSKTRKFCGMLLNREPPIYSKKEIETMDNGQALDVMIYGGGYNCRHRWRPVSDELAAELRAT